ncbi:hypothetical protein LG201_07935 [Methylobacillus gramineus]|uniref:hypothetical protein n=1 Tax=Methylobacillus gramineus TaxID=755169 RepID=UPI001D0002D1|nr:hypothetical protein [Methylobacillus gramineus]MCB5185132.1 hypothetical protein [Methylobacillus gramineus]
MFSKDIEQSIYDSLHYVKTLKTLKNDIAPYANILTVEDVLDLIDQRIQDAERQYKSSKLAFKLDSYLPHTTKAALINT